MQTKLRPSRDELLAICWKLPFSDQAKYFNVGKTTLGSWKRYYKISKYESQYGYLPVQLNQQQTNIVNGILLGDAWIFKTGGKNASLRCEHSIKDREYVDGIYKLLQPFSKSITTRNGRTTVINDRKVVGGATCLFNSIASPIFTELRNQWYFNSKKIIPTHLNLNFETVAYWFCDDGCNYECKYKKSKFNKRYGLFCTNGYDLSQVEYLVSQLSILKVNSRIKFQKSNNCKQPMIIVNNDSFNYLINNIKPYIPWVCMQRKITL